MSVYGNDIRKKFEEMTSEQLTKVYNDKDYGEYTKEVFDAIRDILYDRGLIWKCPKCGEAVENSYDTCWNCGTAEDGSPSENETEFNKIKRTIQNEMERNGNRGGFFSFQKMITPSFIRAIYVLGIIGIVIYGGIHTYGGIK